MSAQQDRIERSLKRLGFQLTKGRGKAFKITAVGWRSAHDRHGHHDPEPVRALDQRTHQAKALMRVTSVARVGGSTNER